MQRRWVVRSTFLVGVGLTGVVVACGSSSRDGFRDVGHAPESGFLNEGGVLDGDNGGLPEGVTRDPVDCEEAKVSKSYVGCDYWPTVTANPVWKIFDFAAVVANTGSKDASVTVTGPSGTNKYVVVPAGQTRKVFLPWVDSLKGADFDSCTSPPSFDKSVVAEGGAYHLVSSVPVIVYQFNALEFEGAGGQDSSGRPKDWSSCPALTQECNDPVRGRVKFKCLSFSNDASLLLPSTAMTGNYRVSGLHGWSDTPRSTEEAINGATLTLTATQADTSVTVTLSPTASVRASEGGAVPAARGGQTLKLTLARAGDVVELAAEKGKSFDFSGSLVQANKPIQVITGVPCINLPEGKNYCDHVEEAVLPAETLGRRYAVVRPTGAKGMPVKHKVRLFGNKDNTVLTYTPSRPSECPPSLSAGGVGDCNIVDQDFEVTGSNEFSIATFLLGAEAIDPTDVRGDPSASNVVALEQFRTKYVFLAPDDYPISYADVTAAEDAAVLIDGKPVSAPWSKIASGPLGVRRVKLGDGQNGAHVLTSQAPVGVQIIGYGESTTYQYPAGLNLKLIAPPPSPPK